ncbi:ubiquinol-cytochrome c reductase cytochrome c1 subunit [Tranquillimonas rosea]|uniref:Cytochrome c1 n=1 Tax=Tranquillimonas rosea TaxID=641238 RepID=A0A1H9UKZ3_9RHOB|nr:cytochrome c1 [Tranquillimonas rosea]SES10126.1 ubiquinol-cytochrome c reductase cytochrome c1 subunit [Tranquillimonas rosea]
MFDKFALAATLALGLVAGPALAQDDHGEEEGGGGGGHEESHITDYSFPFEGPFGTYDQAQLQRGMKVYTEVCSSCHGLKFVPIRSVGDESGPNLPDAQVRAYAEFFEIWDPTMADGQGDFRPATPTDTFPESSMANAPDLSLMAKARAGFHGPYGLGINQFLKGMGGPEYIASLMTGYTGEQRTQAGATLYENTAFPGGWIAMPPPLYGDDVSFDTDAPTDLESLSKDVSAFLMWTAEPKLAARKQAGFTGVLMLSVLAVLLYLTNKRIWAPIKHRHEGDKSAE